MQAGFFQTFSNYASRMGFIVLNPTARQKTACSPIKERCHDNRDFLLVIKTNAIGADPFLVNCICFPGAEGFFQHPMITLADKNVRIPFCE